MAIFIFFLFFLQRANSESSGNCTKPNNCSPSFIFFVEHPKSSTDNVVPSNISLSCSVTGAQSVSWIRNNSDMDAVHLQGRLNSRSPSSIITSTLSDSPPIDKFPYYYQCIAYGRCCETILSKSIRIANDVALPFKIIQIKFDERLMSYSGYGKVIVLCRGEGNNLTSVYWIQVKSNGTFVRLNSTKFDYHEPGIWSSELIHVPFVAVDNELLKYRCVVKNKCCQNASLEKDVTIRYIRTTTCQNLLPNVLKPVDFFVHRRKRSVDIMWTYNKDPEDTALELQFENRTWNEFNFSISKFAVDGLVPNRRYSWYHRVAYNTTKGIPCKTFTYGRSFRTLPDVPGIPRDLSIQTFPTSFHVRWLPPIGPDDIIYYILSWKKVDEANYTELNTSTNTSYRLMNLDRVTKYSIKVKAVNNVGPGNDTIATIVSTYFVPGKSRTNTGVIVGSLMAAVALSVVALAVFFVLKRKTDKDQLAQSVKDWENSRHFNRQSNDTLQNERSENKAAQLSVNPDLFYSENSPELSYIVLLQDWEISPDNLKILDEKLGGGQFGIVMKGMLLSGKGDPEIVAVKTLKANATESDLEDLMSELALLREVNKVAHPNVIRLIGGSSIGGKLHVVTEFCSGGSLLKVLINSRAGTTKESPSTYVNLQSTLNHRQLLKIAADVSNGMIHLASIHVVHRDLAARNILIGDDNMAKVSDLGLARDVGGAEEYIRNNQNLLPVKWMALESLIHGRFTTASDVWSYGVLLFEITTLGEEPYKNISPYHIVNHVGSGARMPKPPSCSNEIYEIMSRCWKVESSNRPTFEEIYKSLQNMLVDSQKSYINVTQILDEGDLSTTNDGRIIPLDKVRDGSVRYMNS